MKKNICFVLDNLIYGGIERIAINYLKMIDKEKYNLDVVILSNFTDIINEIPKECNVIKINIPRNHNPLSRAGNMNKRFAGAFLYYPTFLLKKIFIYPIDYIKTIKLRKKRYDAAIAFSGHMNDGYFVLDLINSTKKIIWAHGMIYQYLLLSPAFEKMYNKFDTIVSINNLYQDDIYDSKPYLKYNIVNLYNPILKKNSSSELCKYDNYILSVSRLSSPKDFLTLIKAYNELDNNIKEKYKLVIVGDGEDRKKIENEVENLGLNDKVVFEGTQSDVDKYYKKAKVFVLSTKVEGLPTVLLEAMQNGCPVISTDAPYGPRDIIRNNEFGILCPVGDYHKMSEEISRLLNDDDLRNHYIKKGYERVKDFDAKKIIEEFYSIID